MNSSTHGVVSPADKPSSQEQCGHDAHRTDDETAITEITLLPDGRLCLFGASGPVLELLADLRLGDESLHLRLAALRSVDQQTATYQDSKTP